MFLSFKDKWDLYKANKALRDEERPYLEELKSAKKEGKSERETHKINSEMTA